jgi:hypothetical protein
VPNQLLPAACAQKLEFMFRVWHFPGTTRGGYSFRCSVQWTAPRDVVFN